MVYFFLKLSSQGIGEMIFSKQKMWKLAAAVSGWPYLKSVFFSHRYPRANRLQKGCNCQRLKDSSTQGTTKISYPTGIRKIIISKSTFYFGDIWYMTHVSFQKGSICFHQKNTSWRFHGRFFPLVGASGWSVFSPFPQRPLPNPSASPRVPEPR